LGGHPFRAAIKKGKLEQLPKKQKAGNALTREINPKKGCLLADKFTPVLGVRGGSEKGEGG